MKKIQDNSCKCQTVSGESKSRESCSSGNDEPYACNKFSDPDWIKENIEYFPAGFAAPEGIFKNIFPKEAYQMLQQNPHRFNSTILDVKTRQEYRQRHLPGSLNMDFFSPTFKDELFSLDKEKCYVVICKIGVRSETTMNVMKKMGFNEVYNVTGGDDRWIAEEIPYGQEHCNANVSSCISA